ncbi:MAG: glycosyltransferase family 4 protein [Deferribacteraceae bacterium]|jgi:glycosyltransferase involved in cell wall biosynthesis|nr:glycosyltransferase family 4 protein [Deferribacteraceae bacterium]
MNIVLFCHAINQISGASKVCIQMASYWAEKGHSVTILSHYGLPESHYPVSSKVKLKTAGIISKYVPNKIVCNLLSPFLLPSLYSTIKNENIDLIITNNAPYYGLLYATLLSWLTKIPVIIWKHAGHFMKSSPMYKVTRKLCFPKADAIVLLTEGDEKHASELSRNCFTIKNPAEQTDFTDEIQKEQNRETDNDNTALFVGRLAEQKSVDHLIHAWKKAIPEIPQWKLLIVGDGEKRGKLESLAKRLHISKSVLFVGEVKNVQPYYKKAAFFVMSSMYEGLPVSLIEAVSNGLPLISYNCPYGPENVIEHNKNGLLIESGNINALSEAIIKMATSYDMRKTFSNASKIKSNEFLLGPIAEQWDKVFEFVLKKTG